MKKYEKDVTSAEHHYEIELQQREQIMKTRQEQYTEGCWQTNSNRSLQGQ